MDRCNETQENIAAGLVLSAGEQRHAAECARCAAVAASYSLLDATLETFAPAVPDGFADRVMALVAAEDRPVDRVQDRGEDRAPERGGRASAGARSSRWFERRPIQLVVAHAAALCAVFNVAWFVMRVFVADVALGGTP